jgi:hypothetical protein
MDFGDVERPGRDEMLDARPSTQPWESPQHPYRAEDGEGQPHLRQRQTKRCGIAERVLQDPNNEPSVCATTVGLAGFGIPSRLMRPRPNRRAWSTSPVSATASMPGSPCMISAIRWTSSLIARRIVTAATTP